MVGRGRGCGRGFISHRVEAYKVWGEECDVVTYDICVVIVW